jgi:hypothetical protein
MSTLLLPWPWLKVHIGNDTANFQLQKHIDFLSQLYLTRPRMRRNYWTYCLLRPSDTTWAPLQRIGCDSGCSRQAALEVSFESCI